MSNRYHFSFSSLNGQRDSPSYAHKLEKDKFNCYQQALVNIMPTFFEANRGKPIPLYGIGGSFPSLNRKDTDFFRILGNSSEEKIPKTLNTMMALYMNTLTLCQGAAEANCTSCIRHITNWVKDQSHISKYKYTVVVIFLHHQISDYGSVLKQLFESSKAFSR